MPRILQVAQLGQPVLRKTAQVVRDFSKAQELIDDMIETCKDFNAVGIAAPQVYQSFQIFILMFKPHPHCRSEPMVIINPKIISYGKKVISEWEGCLSIPGIRGKVSRHASILVTYQDGNEKRVRTRLKDYNARIFQHEFDHLQGKVFLDGINPSELITQKEYERLRKAKALK